MADQEGYYHAFGLKIASDIPLSELRTAVGDGPPDIRFIERPIGRSLPGRDQGVVMDFRDPNGLVMAWPDVAAFRLVDCSTVWVEKYSGVQGSYVAFPILGPVMAWMLDWRGYFVLHASAININGRSIALMGDKLAGKSTTAAAFLRAGHDLITDDLLALSFDERGQPICHPAFPQVKLADEAAASVEIPNAKALPLVYEGFSKRQHKLSRMHTEATGIHFLAVLDRGGKRPSLSHLGPAEAIGALNRFSYMPRFADAPQTQDKRARHFKDCARLADKAQVVKLQIPDALDRLEETVALVVRELDRIV